MKDHIKGKAKETEETIEPLSLERAESVIDIVTNMAWSLVYQRMTWGQVRVAVANLAPTNIARLAAVDDPGKSEEEVTRLFEQLIEVTGLAARLKLPPHPGPSYTQTTSTENENSPYSLAENPTPVQFTTEEVAALQSNVDGESFTRAEWNDAVENDRRSINDWINNFLPRYLLAKKMYEAPNRVEDDQDEAFNNAFNEISKEHSHIIGYRKIINGEIVVNGKEIFERALKAAEKKLEEKALARLNLEHAWKKLEAQANQKIEETQKEIANLKIKREKLRGDLAELQQQMMNKPPYNDPPIYRRLLDIQQEAVRAIVWLDDYIQRENPTGDFQEELLRERRFDEQHIAQTKACLRALELELLLDNRDLPANSPQRTILATELEGFESSKKQIDLLQQQADQEKQRRWIQLTEETFLAQITDIKRDRIFLLAEQDAKHFELSLSIKKEQLRGMLTTSSATPADQARSIEEEIATLEADKAQRGHVAHELIGGISTIKRPLRESEVAIQQLKEEQKLITARRETLAQLIGNGTAPAGWQSQQRFLDEWVRHIDLQLDIAAIHKSRLEPGANVPALDRELQKKETALGAVQKENKLAQRKELESRLFSIGYTEDESIPTTALDERPARLFPERITSDETALIDRGEITLASVGNRIASELTANQIDDRTWDLRPELSKFEDELAERQSDLKAIQYQKSVMDLLKQVRTLNDSTRRGAIDNTYKAGKPKTTFWYIPFPAVRNFFRDRQSRKQLTENAIGLNNALKKLSTCLLTEDELNETRRQILNYFHQANVVPNALAARESMTNPIWIGRLNRDTGNLVAHTDNGNWIIHQVPPNVFNRLRADINRELAQLSVDQQRLTQDRIPALSQQSENAELAGLRNTVQAWHERLDHNRRQIDGIEDEYPTEQQQLDTYNDLLIWRNERQNNLSPRIEQLVAQEPQARQQWQAEVIKGIEDAIQSIQQHRALLAALTPISPSLNEALAENQHFLQTAEDRLQAALPHTNPVLRIETLSAMQNVPGVASAAIATVNESLTHAIHQELETEHQQLIDQQQRLYAFNLSPHNQAGQQATTHFTEELQRNEIANRLAGQPVRFDYLINHLNQRENRHQEREATLVSVQPWQPGLPLPPAAELAVETRFGREGNGLPTNLAPRLVQDHEQVGGFPFYQGHGITLFQQEGSRRRPVVLIVTDAQLMGRNVSLVDGTNPPDPKKLMRFKAGEAPGLQQGAQHHQGF